MGRKFGGSAPFSGRGGWVPSNKIPSAEAYLHTKLYLDASSRLATIEMGRKLGRGLRSLFGKGERERGPHLTQSRLGRGLPPYQSCVLIHVAIWPQQIWAEN